jgi:hypothetical protein
MGAERLGILLGSAVCATPWYALGLALCAVFGNVHYLGFWAAGALFIAYGNISVAALVAIAVAPIDSMGCTFLLPGLLLHATGAPPIAGRVLCVCALSAEHTRWAAGVLNFLFPGRVPKH